MTRPDATENTPICESLPFRSVMSRDTPDSRTPIRFGGRRTSRPDGPGRAECGIECGVRQCLPRWWRDSEPGCWDGSRPVREIGSLGAVSGAQHDVVDVVRGSSGPRRTGTPFVDLDLPLR